MNNDTCIKNVQAIPEAGFQKQNSFLFTPSQKAVTSNKNKKKSEFQPFLDNEIDKLAKLNRTI